MNLNELARHIGAQVLAQPPGPAEIEQIYAGDRISDLLAHAHERTLLVSNLAGPQLLRLADLMDVAALCLVNGHMPDAAFIAAAQGHGMGLLVSSCGMFETCGRLYERLPGQRR